MNRNLHILEAPLTNDQSKLLETMLWHVTTDSDHGEITTWSTWDHILWLLDNEGVDVNRANRAVADLPILERARYPYSLIWRSGAGASAVIQPNETVGLTLAGLYRVDQLTSARLAQMLAMFAEVEASLPPNPYGVRQENQRLNEAVGPYLDSPRRAGRVSINIRTAAELLMHEYAPLVSETEFQRIYEVPLGGSRLAHLRGIQDAPGYMRAIASLAPAVLVSEPVLTVRPELISRRTREAVRDQMSSIVLREIDDMWMDEGFPPAGDPDPVGGERVTRFQGYLNNVDWTDAAHVARAIRVFQIALDFMFHPTANWDPSQQIQRLRRLFAKDGYTLTDHGKITGGPMTAIAPAVLSNVTDPAVILGHLSRIDAAIERGDPAQAIGSAKELVESTAKLILRDRGFTFTKDDDMTALVNRAMVALGIHPKTTAPGPDGGSAVKRILGSVIAVTGGMSELRNSYGTGHGPADRPSALGVRHARLAVNSARLWCDFMIETLADPRAPWRTNSPVPQ